jgi:bifunctional non-homologous end joining protein LigD
LLRLVDLMQLNGHDLRSEPLDSRRERLRQVLTRVKGHTLRYSDDFADPLQLLGAADRMNLEGVVSKLRNQPYKSGKNPGWMKVKTATWRATNRERYKMFERDR